MNRVIILLLVGITASCTKAVETNDHEPDQKEIYKSWVLSRCLSYTFQNENMKQDALNTASAHFEQSTLPVEKFLDSEPIIQKFLSRNYQGSIEGTFNTKKCIDLFNSHELEELYSDFNE